MLFQYVGDETAPKRTTVYGYSFKLWGNPVDVTGEKVILKLEGNASFAKLEQGEIPQTPPIQETNEVVKPAPAKVPGKTFDIKEPQDLSELTEEELEELTNPVKKKKSK